MVMTPRIVRPLRELRRLRRLAEHADVPLRGRGAPDEERSIAGSDLPERLNRIMISPGVLVDIQVLVEAGHANSINAPRAGFVASVSVDGKMSSISRIRTLVQRPVPSPESVSAQIGNVGTGILVLGLIDQIDLGSPDAGLLSSLASSIEGFLESDRYLLLSHSSRPTDSGTGEMSLPTEPTNVSMNRISWGSWNEQHELSAMSARLRPVEIEVG